MTLLHSKNNLFLWMLRIVFATILIYAASSKIIDPVSFADNVSQYRVVGPELSLWTAVFIPCLELVLAICLITGIWLYPAVLTNAFLMFIFLILIFQAYARGLDIECGCFTQDGEANIDWFKISENILFFIGSLVLLWLTSHKEITK